MLKVEWSALGRDLSLCCAPCQRTAPPVLLLRGFDLGDDWAFYPYLIERLAEQRPVWLLPASPPSLVAELDLVEIVLRAWAQGQRPPGFGTVRGPIGLLGHGKGATLALRFTWLVEADAAPVPATPETPVAPVAPPVADPNGTVTAEELFSLPPAKACLSKRRLKVRVRAKPGVKVTSAKP